MKVLLAIATCALLAATGLVGALGAWRHSTPTPTAQLQLAPANAGPAQIVRFTVYDAGIFPREVRASAGVIVLHFEDMSGSSAGLVVASESLQPQTQIVREPRRWRERARLSVVPGRYIVYDASRPLNRATLIIEP